MLISFSKDLHTSQSYSRLGREIVLAEQDGIQRNESRDSTQHKSQQICVIIIIIIWACEAARNVRIFSVSLINDQKMVYTQQTSLLVSC